MIIVRKIDGNWQRWSGVNEPMRRIVSVANLQYADGRVEEVPVAPYEAEALLSADRVAQLLAEGVWGEDDLAPFGLKVAAPFAAPEGKRAIGEARYEEQGDGSVAEIFDVEDIPPPPPPPTVEERLAASGLTLDEIAAALAARQQAQD
jgi:hypothetical protein